MTSRRPNCAHAADDDCEGVLVHIRVAAVQAAPVFLDLDATIDKGVRLIGEAAGNAQLIGFPECWIPGYPWWIWPRPAHTKLDGHL